MKPLLVAAALAVVSVSGCSSAAPPAEGDPSWLGAAGGVLVDLVDASSPVPTSMSVLPKAQPQLVAAAMLVRHTAGGPWSPEAARAWFTTVLDAAGRDQWDPQSLRLSLEAVADDGSVTTLINVDEARNLASSIERHVEAASDAADVASTLRLLARVRQVLGSDPDVLRALDQTRTSPRAAALCEQARSRSGNASARHIDLDVLLAVSDAFGRDVCPFDPPTDGEEAALVADALAQQAAPAARVQALDLLARVSPRAGPAVAAAIASLGRDLAPPQGPVSTASLSAYAVALSAARASGVHVDVPPMMTAFAELVLRWGGALVSSAPTTASTIGLVLVAHALKMVRGTDHDRDYVQLIGDLQANIKSQDDVVAPLRHALTHEQHPNGSAARTDVVLPPALASLDVCGHTPHALDLADTEASAASVLATPGAIAALPTLVEAQRRCGRGSPELGRWRDWLAGSGATAAMRAWVAAEWSCQVGGHPDTSDTPQPDLGVVSAGPGRRIEEIYATVRSDHLRRKGCDAPYWEGAVLIS